MLTSGSRFGKYEIEEILGRGGMGVVYKAHDLQLDRPVAIKVINQEYAAKPEYRERLLHEAKKAAGIDSVYVVKVWEHAEVGDIPYISYEFVSGEDFRTAIDEYPLPDKVQLMKRVAEGMKAIHAIGLIHRDLKPENIKLTPDRTPKILDFGLAKTVRADTIDDTGNIVGTLSYMSPEQVSGRELSVSSDLFSYGVLLYELFTGQRPFQGEHSASVIYSILYEDPRPPRDTNPQIFDWLNLVIMKLLSKNPYDRYKEIQEVLHIIENVQNLMTQPLPSDQFMMPARTVTVIDIKNLSGDETWNYFCAGFSDDLIREVSRRTRLVISSHPGNVEKTDIRDLFATCRSDYIITGNLLKWKEDIKLSISIYARGGEELVFGEEYRGISDNIFEILSKASSGVANALAAATGEISCSVDQFLETEFSAYDYYLKGKGYYQTNKPEDLELAIRMFKKSLDVDPEFALAYTGLSDVYAFQYMAFYDRSPERIELARQNALKALEISPHLPEAERSLGRYYMFTGDNRKAEQAFLKSIESDPKFAIGYRTLAWLKGMHGEPDGALEWANKALSLAPTDLETLLLISLMYLDQRKYTLALATLQRAIELGPDYGRGYYNLGVAYRKLGVFDLAVENFLLAIKYEGDPNSHIDAGYVYTLLGDYDAALRKFRESIEAGLFTFGALYYSGVVEKLKGGDAEARNFFEKSIVACEDIRQKDSACFPASEYCAMSLAQVGKTEEALKIIDDLLNEQGEHPDVLYNTARSHAIMGNKEKALEFIEKARARYAGPSEKEIRADPHFRLIHGDQAAKA